MTLALINSQNCLILERGFQFIFFPNKHFMYIQFCFNMSFEVYEKINVKQPLNCKNYKFGVEWQKQKHHLSQTATSLKFLQDPDSYTLNYAAVCCHCYWFQWLDGKMSMKKPSHWFQLYQHLRKMSLWGSVLGAGATTWRKITGNIKYQNWKLSKNTKHLLVTCFLPLELA